MEFCVINTENVIENLIIATPEVANRIGALPSYTGAERGAVYHPPEPEEPAPTETEQLRADVDFLAAMAGVSL